MNREAKQLKNLIQKAQKILIITHKGPDFDAFCSALILKEVIDTYFPHKEIAFKTRSRPRSNIPHMDEIEVVESIEDEGEDLVIITDAGNWNMCVTDEDTIQNTDAKVVIIDHHDTPSDVYTLTINNNRSSATEQVIALSMDMWGRRFKITESISILGQIGIVTDTGRFLYENTQPETFEIFGKLRRVFNFDLEEFSYKNSKFPFETISPYKIYLENITIIDDMAYTYISKEEIERIEATKLGVNAAQQEVRDRVIRHIQGVHWGFVVKPMFSVADKWQVSFRSTKGYQEVDRIAEKLGGGGHQYSSAAKIDAKSAKEVVEKILSVVNELKES